jgi:spermidine synthase
MGNGLLLARRKLQPLVLFAPLLLLFVVIVANVKFELKIATSAALYFQSTTVAAEKMESYLLLPFVVAFVAGLFTLLGYEMGNLFERFKPLRAYTFNIGGSMAGIAAFFLMSLFQVPPAWWFAIVAVGIILLLRGSAGQVGASAIVLAAICLLVYGLQKDSTWSPYYKITMTNLTDGGKILSVNNIGHQTMQPIKNKEPFYHVPYTSFKHNRFKSALIIGAGSGTDASFALEYGVKRITAVEIDPAIYALGKKYHPLRPYGSFRVKMHINDARAFLRNDRNSYDLIIYALPDSLTLTSSFANLRLESFLFTEESFRSTKERLAKGGLLVLYNYYREEWLIDKIANMLETVFGYPPVVVSYGGRGKAAVFMIGEKLADLKILVEKRPPHAALTHATDEWPFLYMKSPVIPWVFIKALALLAVFSIVLVVAVSLGGTAGAGRGSFFSRGHFFFLGMAFLLLETMSIVRFSLLFGSTWMVNSLVFFSVLAMVLLAVWISARVTIKKLWGLYAALFIILALNYAIPLETLLTENSLLRFFLSSLMIFSPVFLANLIFAQTFKEEEGTATVSLAANILGSLFGGMFEYASLALGYRNLVVFVALFYALSFILVNVPARRAAVLKKTA